MMTRSIEDFYHDEFGRVFATLLRFIADFHVAEDAVQDAFAVAFEQWPRGGWPDNPRAWLVSTARHKAVDVLRRAGRLEKVREQLRTLSADAADDVTELVDAAIPDERLRLIFTCCHPALAPEAQVALSLRTLCGLSTEEIARAFLVGVPTMAQRLVRAKRKIQEAGIPYEVPPARVLPERLETVMAVVYLVFNEGYAASGGDSLVRADLCQEAIRLGRLLCTLLPAEGEPRGLLALMLLHDARRAARTTADGDLIVLEDQDRTLWNREQIEGGLAFVDAAFSVPVPGVYAIQAAIAAEHARAASARDTDWRRIAELYDFLLQTRPSPVVRLNRAVAVAMDQGPEAGLRLIAKLKSTGDLESYHLLWATEADLLRRLGRLDEARVAYDRALSLATTEPERRFLLRRIEEVAGR